MTSPRDADTSSAIEREVLAPLMRAHAVAQSARHPAYDPLVTETLSTIVNLLGANLQRPPALDVLARSITALERILPSSPFTPTLASHSSSSPSSIEISPRSNEAMRLAARLSGTLGLLLADVSTIYSDVIRSITVGEAERTVRLRIGALLFFLYQEKWALVPHFPHLRALSADPAQRSELFTPIRQAVDEMLAKPTQLNNDVQLCYVIARLPLVAPEEDSVPSEDPLRRHLAKSFQHTYQGDAHRRLLDFVSSTHAHFFHNAPEERRPYYKGTSIVQSSGTGKTRMVHQLGQMTPLLFVCMRPDTTSARHGYPLGDKPFTDLVRRFASYTGSEDHKAALLLATWFSTLADTLEPLADAEAKCEKLKQLNGFGNEQHESVRKHFFLDVEAKACVALLLEPVTGESDAIFLQHLEAPVRRLSRQIRQVHVHLESHGRALARDVPFFVAIDECVQLGRPLFNGICRAWAWITELEDSERRLRQGAQTHGQAAGKHLLDKDPLVCFWLLLLSTNSSASTLVRPQSEQTSTRYPNAVPLPTFVGVGFDVLRVELAPLRSASHVAQLEHYQYYGRPLWTSLLRERFWYTAIFKLLGGEPFERANRRMCFNMLASRLALQYMPTRSTDGVLFGQQATFARDAVDRHMRILHRVDSDAVMHICSPSEPVLAIAASLIMMGSADGEPEGMDAPRQISSDRYGSILKTFKDMCLPSADVDVLKGIRGELLARMLLMTAWDAAKLVNAPDANYNRCAEHLAKPVALDDILAGLVQLDEQGKHTVHERIRAVCNVIASRSPPGAEVQAWTHFTHFDLLKVQVEQISPEYLWYCWKRGVAIQMAHPQHGIDGILPVFVGDLSQEFGGDEGEAPASRQMTYVAWEAKNRATTSQSRADDAANKPAHAGPELRHERNCRYAGQPALTKHGMLTLLADMGAKEGSARLRPIKETDSTQLWIRGLEGSYPCLDALRIRPIMATFLRTVAAHKSYDTSNQMPDPMDLDLALDDEEREPFASALQPDAVPGPTASSRGDGMEIE